MCIGEFTDMRRVMGLLKHIKLTRKNHEVEISTHAFGRLFL